MAKRELLTSPLHGTNGQLMIGAAHRYCLGRRTYIAAACCEWLRCHWTQVQPQTRCNIARDTAAALMRGEAGSEGDAKDWENLLRFIWDSLTGDQRTWVLRETAHVPGAWPLKD